MSLMDEDNFARERDSLIKTIEDLEHKVLTLEDQLEAIEKMAKEARGKS